jgi:hypothetical protein
VGALLHSFSSPLFIYYFFFFFAFEDSDGDLVPWLIENKRYGWIYDIYIYKKKLGEHGWLVGDQYTRYNAINVKGVLSAWHNIWSTIAGRGPTLLFICILRIKSPALFKMVVFFFFKRKEKKISIHRTRME